MTAGATERFDLRATPEQVAKRCCALLWAF
jgi:hypothetical protein